VTARYINNFNQQIIMPTAMATPQHASSDAAPKATTLSKLAQRYRGVSLNPASFEPLHTDPMQATVEDPSALSCNPTDPISHALTSAFERDFTHLTVVSDSTRALLGYLSIPHLRILLDTGKVQESDEVSKAMIKFRRKGRVYKVITMDTPLEELELFFNGGENGEGGKQEFAVVTDERRRFVLGVATRSDLEEFARRRPA
jgi:CBS domain-containing protein